jgi:hypothetical protein
MDVERTPASLMISLRAAWLLLYTPLITTLFLTGAPMSYAQTATTTNEEIAPPFGLRWGETPDRLEKLLTGAKADIIERREVEGRIAWTVEGILQQGLKRTVFYFKNDALVEVELQYENPDWDTVKYDEFMGQVRRKVEAKFGTGRLIARSKAPEKTPAGDVTQTVVGYKWEKNSGTIQLFYYSAESGQENYRTVSVHYKTNL